jgi:hypothetical protein
VWQSLCSKPYVRASVVPTFWHACAGVLQVCNTHYCCSRGRQPGVCALVSASCFLASGEYVCTASSVLAHVQLFACPVGAVPAWPLSGTLCSGWSTCACIWQKTYSCLQCVHAALCNTWKQSQRQLQKHRLAGSQHAVTEAALLNVALGMHCCMWQAVLFRRQQRPVSVCVCLCMQGSCWHQPG